jgi:hypothetical protein
VRCSSPTLHGKFSLGPARPSGEACRHPQIKTGITRNIGKLASLFNDLFPYNIQSLDEMGRSTLAALVKGRYGTPAKFAHEGRHFKFLHHLQQNRLELQIDSGTRTA